MKQETLRKLTDYILLNAYSVDSSGLYNGKAGLALALFEVARVMQDERVEEHAFELLQEALLSKTADISFENGLSGIGYVLLHLIREGLVDADFDELFAGNQAKIEDGIRLFELQPPKERQPFLYLRMVYHLSLLHRLQPQDELAHAIRFILTEAAGFLTARFGEVLRREEAVSKNELLFLWEVYLKVNTETAAMPPDAALLEMYAECYLAGRLASSFSAGHYLGRIAAEEDNVLLLSVAADNRAIALAGLQPQILSLARRIDVLSLLRQTPEVYARKIGELENGFCNAADDGVLEKHLLEGLDPQTFMAGYQAGIARLVVYCAGRELGKNRDFIVV